MEKTPKQIKDSNSRPRDGEKILQEYYKATRPQDTEILAGKNTRSRLMNLPTPPTPEND